MRRSLKNPLHSTLRMAHKLAATVIGATVLLAILATEYVWARRLLQHLKARAARVLGHPTGSKGS